MFLLAAILLTAVTPLFSSRRPQTVVVFNQFWMLLLFIFAIACCFYLSRQQVFSVTVMQFDEINLQLQIGYDTFTRVMVLFILFIGSLIYCYAQNYLESDVTRMRFLAQFNLVIFSVLLLVMAENLLTAFVGWQLIGINLYILLNHYHYDRAANKAAKKKFVINRLGDCSFLFAIVIAYQTQQSSAFSALITNPYAGLICGLLFLSVMTKCAQFPFHVWLLDTMETPTPVSALMHAGIINAGGVLLTRISPALIHLNRLLYMILAIGLLSACLSSVWMVRQADIKKKLAYSTMGQMGYMLMQCSLGAFPAAVFHLISHGFYKASLFMNSGATLRLSLARQTQNIKLLHLIVAAVVAAVILTVSLFTLRDWNIAIPVLMYGFIYITLVSLMLKVDALFYSDKFQYVLMLLFIWVLLTIYLYVFGQFAHVLQYYDYPSSVSHSIQYTLLTLIFLAQCWVWLQQQRWSQYNFKDQTEWVLRHFMLNPLRRVGDWFNLGMKRQRLTLIYSMLLILVMCCFAYGLVDMIHDEVITTPISTAFICIFLIAAIVVLIIANRSLKLLPQICWLALFEFLFTNIGLYDVDNRISAIGLFHLINSSLVLIMLCLLTRKHQTYHVPFLKTNHLPVRLFYLVFGLLLLIGIPGTASFISEFFLLHAMLAYQTIYVVMYLVMIIMLSIVIMHSLQLYAFNARYYKILSEPIAWPYHILFLAIIILNIFCGVDPAVLLTQLS